MFHVLLYIDCWLYIIIFMLNYLFQTQMPLLQCHGSRECIYTYVCVQRLLNEGVVEQAVCLCFLLGLHALYDFVWLLLRAANMLSSQQSHCRVLSLLLDWQSVTLHCSPPIMKDVLKWLLLEQDLWNTANKTATFHNCAIGLYIFASVRNGNLK